MLCVYQLLLKDNGPGGIHPVPLPPAALQSLLLLAPCSISCCASPGGPLAHLAVPGCPAVACWRSHPQNGPAQASWTGPVTENLGQTERPCPGPFLGTGFQRRQSDCIQSGGYLINFVGIIPMISCLVKDFIKRGTHQLHLALAHRPREGDGQAAPAQILRDREITLPVAKALDHVGLQVDG